MTRENKLIGAGYRVVPVDFVRHLVTTLVIASVLALGLAGLFNVPEAPPLTIQQYATTHPIGFEIVALRALDGQGRIANYGPPYNAGTGNVESVMQTVIGVLYPLDTAHTFILGPLQRAAVVNPAILDPLAAYREASSAQRARWATRTTAALQRATVHDGQVVLPAGRYGPVPALLTDMLALGRSGLLSGALVRNPSVLSSFDSQNALLYLQGTPLHDVAQPLRLTGEEWGIIHSAVPGYPGAWWMTIPTWVYQWPPVAQSPAADAVALLIGFLFWGILAATPWIPGWNRLPQALGLYRLMWKGYYHPGGGGARPTIHRRTLA